MAKPGLAIRRPTQKRGKERFEAILDAAEELLEHAEPSAISIYDLAKHLDVSPPSIYHFFPDPSLVFVALAERYLEWFKEVPTEVDEPVESWQELLDIQCHRMRAVYDTRASVRKVLLGGGYSPEVRQRDFATVRILAQKILDGFQEHFVLPEIPNLVDYIAEMIVINDSLWMLAIFNEGSITEAAEERVRIARTAHMRLILPERLYPRSKEASASQAAVEEGPKTAAAKRGKPAERASSRLSIKAPSRVVSKKS